jgi:hypothetical protein
MNILNYPHDVQWMTVETDYSVGSLVAPGIEPETSGPVVSNSEKLNHRSGPMA